MTNAKKHVLYLHYQSPLYSIKALASLYFYLGNAKHKTCLPADYEHKKKVHDEIINRLHSI
jgi:hypothetical protein